MISQHRACSDCTNVQAGLAGYWWHRIIIFGSTKGRVELDTHFMTNNYVISCHSDLKYATIHDKEVN